MSNHSEPSIFTSRDSFIQKPTAPPQRSHTPTRLPRTSSPFRRQSSPHCLEPYKISAIVEGSSSGAVATSSLVTSAVPLSEKVVGGKDVVGIIRNEGRTGTQESGTKPAPSAWVSGVVPAGDHLVNSGLRTRAASVSIASPAGALQVPSQQTLHPVSHATTPNKRGATEPAGPASEPNPKRPRFLARKIKHTLDGFPFGPSNFNHPPLEPPSPLFFSNTPRQRPPLPPRFSSSEAAARMLSKARTEDSHVKTVSLARGTITTPAGFPPTSAPRQDSVSRRSLERSVTGRSDSPEAGGRYGEGGGLDVGGMLGSIGILELLEQDERPTFIVDLGDNANYGPGSLHLVFANSSLRSYHGMPELVSGTAAGDASPAPNAYLQFKSWLLSASVDGESLNVCLPSFVYAGVTWSCSTLRKRLRIIGGAFMTSPAASNPPTGAASVSPSAKPLRMRTAPTQTAGAGSASEPADYFAGAVLSPARSSPPSEPVGIPKAAVVPTIESQRRESNGHGPLLPPQVDLSGATDLLPSPSTYVSSSAGRPMRSSYGSSAVNSSASRVATVASDAPSFDWTRLPVTDNMPRHIQFARSVDWASTSLGPIELWCSDLRQMCNLIMASPHPAAMYWGEDLIAIYNEAYILLAGQKHPKLMGQSYSEAWAEIWDDVKDVFANAKSTGEATMKDDDCLFMKRNSYLEETYFSWSIIPMVGCDGSVMGLYNPAFEKTRRKIAERRMLTLREVGERTASARDVRGFWAQVLDSFEFNEYDSPFLLLYSVADEGDSDSSSIHSNSVFAVRQCTLEGALGVPEEHVAAPHQIDLKTGMEGFGPVFREVMGTDKPVLLEVGTKELPESLLAGLQLRGFGDPVRAVVVCPIYPTTGDSNVLGFLVLGVNPRRPYDDDYSLFVQLLSRQLATSLASVVLFEEEIRRGQKAAKLAALDRIELSEQLAARTQEAIESETKFTRMAEFAPVGMFIANSEGRITFANDTWYGISRVTKDESMADTWMESVKPEDHELVKQLWKDLVVGTKPVSSEFRFKAQWEGRSGTRGDTWVLFSAYPEKYADGKLKSVFGSITDISQQKWAEGIQTRKMEEAVELKRQQENFIDITSHEMRNPLSAILQCSDEITTSLTKFRQTEERVIPDELLMSCLDSAQIINLCSQHQKRIVDDVLT